MGSVMDKELKEYRNIIINAEKETQDAYDKAVISLSGGALAVSFAFVKDIITPETICSKGLLIWAWISWGLSICAMLGSYFTSHLALRKTLKQINNNKLYCSHVGGTSDYITSILNMLGGLLFLAGVILISVFVKLNL